MPESNSKCSFKELLVEEGFTPSRVKDITDAMDVLHSTLSKCDSKNRERFFSKDVGSRLKEYAFHEGLIDVSLHSVKKDFCYMPFSTAHGNFVNLVKRDHPDKQIVCYEENQVVSNERKIDGSPVTMNFSSFQDASVFCTEQNLRIGLKGDDVLDIMRSHEIAAKSKVGFPDSNKKLIEAISSLQKELMFEKVNRGLSIDEAAVCPAIVLADMVVADIHNKAAYAFVPPVKVVIQKDQDGEYRVPGPKGKEEAGAYYTDDNEDAENTAVAMHGKHIHIEYKKVKQHVSVEDGKPAVDVPVKSGRSRR